MRTFREFLNEQLEEAFVSGGKKYTFAFGKYYCDGKQISKEEYHAAKPLEPKKEKKNKKQSKPNFGKLDSETCYQIADNIGDIIGGTWNNISDDEITLDVDNADNILGDDYLLDDLQEYFDDIEQTYGLKCDIDYGKNQEEVVIKLL